MPAASPAGTRVSLGESHPAKLQRWCLHDPCASMQGLFVHALALSLLVGQQLSAFDYFVKDLSALVSRLHAS